MGLVNGRLGCGILAKRSEDRHTVPRSFYSLPPSVSFLLTLPLNHRTLLGPILGAAEPDPCTPRFDANRASARLVESRITIPEARPIHLMPPRVLITCPLTHVVSEMQNAPPACPERIAVNRSSSEERVRFIVQVPQVTVGLVMLPLSASAVDVPDVRRRVAPRISPLLTAAHGCVLPFNSGRQAFRPPATESHSLFPSHTIDWMERDSRVTHFIARLAAPHAIVSATTCRHTRRELPHRNLKTIEPEAFGVDRRGFAQMIPNAGSAAKATAWGKYHFRLL